VRDALAVQVKDKHLLGYHDVRFGNDPDKRLLHFVQNNLQRLLPEARAKFDQFKNLLAAYADGDHSYNSFAARVKRRMRGEPEDLAPIEPDEPEIDPDLGYEDHSSSDDDPHD
jgi:hypothetical protein